MNGMLPVTKEVRTLFTTTVAIAGHASLWMLVYNINNTIIQPNNILIETFKLKLNLHSYGVNEFKTCLLERPD